MRLGGDEFVVYATGVSSKEKGQKIIRRFFDSVEMLHFEELGEHNISISVGVSFYFGNDHVSFNELYLQADRCAYESKEKKGNYVTFC